MKARLQRTSVSRVAEPGKSPVSAVAPAPALRSRNAIRGAVAVVLLLPNTVGCYTTRYVPEGTVQPEMRVSLSITDRGRVAIADSLGTGVLKVNGRLLSATDSQYVVSVSDLDLMNGRTARWNGETVGIDRQHVGGVGQRTLSRSRTGALAAGVIAAIVLIAVQSITGFLGGGSNTKTPPDGGNNT